jgi:hypothetical protein
MYTHSGLLQKQIYLGVPYLNDVKLLYNFLLNGMFGSRQTLSREQTLELMLALSGNENLKFLLPS